MKKRKKNLINNHNFKKLNVSSKKKSINKFNDK